MVRILTLVLICSLLTACNLSSSTIESTPTPDIIATQVSLLLTQAPTATATQAIPTATDTQAITSTETQPAPTPTETTTLPTQTNTVPPADDPPDWKDTLDTGKAFYQYETDNTRVTQETGRLVLTGINANGWLGWSMTFSRKPENFRLEATFVPQACSGSDIYGLMFRAPNTSSGYFFGVTCDGRYNLHVRDFDNDIDTVLVNLTNGPGIQTGANAANRLGVKAEGSNISLYVNDVLLHEASDSSYSSGNFGAFVAANETNGFTVWMEEISLWDIP